MSFFKVHTCVRGGKSVGQVLKLDDRFKWSDLSGRAGECGVKRGLILIVILEVLIWIVYLRKVSVSNLTFIALLPSEGVPAQAAAGVHVALQGHRADGAAAALLRTHTDKHTLIK